MAHAVHSHGAPKMRVEDEHLITGRGTYASDWNLPGQLYAHFVRADRAHAEIVAIKVDAALKHPGVKRVYSGADAVRAGYTKYLIFLIQRVVEGEEDHVFALSVYSVANN